VNNPNPFCIREEEFTLVSFVEATMSPNHDRLLVREKDGIDPAYLDKVADDLRQRTSVKNAPSVDKNYVEDPQVGHVAPGSSQGKVYKGRYRGVSVRTETRGGSGVVIQTLAYGLVVSPDKLPVAELVSDDRKLIRPHAINNVPVKDQQEYRYRGIDPAYVETIAQTIALTGGTIEVRTVRMQDGSHNIHILVDVVTWGNFTYTSPDLTWKDNEGTQHERLNKIWHGIKNTDTLTGLYTPAAGYNVMQVNLTENLDGSITVQRVEYKEASADADLNEALKAHGLYPGVMTRVINLKEAYKTEPALVPIAGAVTEWRTDLRPDGLWNSRQVNETVSWPNTTPTYTIERFDGNGGWEESSGYIATGVPIAGAAAFVTALKANTTIKAAAWRDAGQGEAVIEYVQKGSTVAIDKETSRRASSGEQPPSVTHTWYGVPLALMDETYVTAAAYLGEAGDIATYSHKEHSRDYNRDGTGIVTATAWIPDGGDDSGFVDKEGDNLYEYRVVVQKTEFDWQATWSYVRTGYRIVYKHTESAAYNYLIANVCLEGTSLTKVGRWTWRITHVNEIRYSSVWKPGPVNTTTWTPTGAGNFFP
jgi:hypothetical protein